VDNILVDGTLMEVKIIEEWGFNLGENACLFEEENNFATSHADQDDVHQEEDIYDGVNLAVENLENQGVEEEECNVSEAEVHVVDTPSMAVVEPLEEVDETIGLEGEDG
jgi:hypothetical protein